jgi:hypothetical protein
MDGDLHVIGGVDLKQAAPSCFQEEGRHVIQLNIQLSLAQALTPEGNLLNLAQHTSHPQSWGESLNTV